MEKIRFRTAPLPLNPNKDEFIQELKRDLRRGTIFCIAVLAIWICLSLNTGRFTGLTAVCLALIITFWSQRKLLQAVVQAKCIELDVDLEDDGIRLRRRLDTHPKSLVSLVRWRQMIGVEAGLDGIHLKTSDGGIVLPNEIFESDGQKQELVRVIQDRRAMNSA